MLRSLRNASPLNLSSFGRGWLALSGLLIAGLLVVIPGPARANGGTVIFNGDTGPFNVYLVLSPSPPTPTVPAHLTMLVTQKSSDRAITGATVLIDPEMTGMAMPGAERKRFVQSPDRPNQYDVDVPVAMEGIWRFKITIADPRLGTSTFSADTKVEKPDAPWPVILAILIALPVMAGMTWFFLFRGQQDEDVDEDVDEADQAEQGIARPKKPLRPEKKPRAR